jgi:hypothetical protein
VESPARHLPLVLAPVQRRSDDGGGPVGNGADAGGWGAPGVSPVSEPAPVQRRVEEDGGGSSHSVADVSPHLGDGGAMGNGDSGSPLGTGDVSPDLGDDGRDRNGAHGAGAAGTGADGGGPGVADTRAHGTSGDGGGGWAPDAGAGLPLLDAGDDSGTAGIGATGLHSSGAAATDTGAPADLSDALSTPMDAPGPVPTGDRAELTVSRQADLHTLIPPGTRPKSGGLGPPIELPGPGPEAAGPAVVQRSIEPAGRPTTDPSPAGPLRSFPGAELPIVQRSRGTRPPAQARGDRTEVVAGQPDASPELGSTLPIQRSPADATAAGVVTPGSADAGVTSSARPEESADHDGDGAVVPTLGAGAAPSSADGGLEVPPAALSAAGYEAVAMPVAAVQRRPDAGAGDRTPPAGDPRRASLTGLDPDAGGDVALSAPEVAAVVGSTPATAGTTPAAPDLPIGDASASADTETGGAPSPATVRATATLPLAVQRSLAPTLENASVLGVRPGPSAVRTGDVVPVPTWSTSTRPEATPPTVQRWPGLGNLSDAGRGALGDAVGAGRDAFSGATDAGRNAFRVTTGAGRSALTAAIGSGRGALDDALGAGRGTLDNAIGTGGEALGMAGGQARDWASAGRDAASDMAGGLPSTLPSLPDAGVPSLGNAAGALPLALPRGISGLPGAAGDALGALSSGAGSIAGTAAALPGAAAQAASGLVPDLGLPAVPTPGGLADAASGVAAAAGVPMTEITFPSPAEPEPSPAAAATGAGGGGAAGAGGSSSADLDELAGKLYDRIRWRLRSELRLDRERAGLGAGVRR